MSDDTVLCPACAQTSARPAFVKSGYPFRRCAACGFLFASPYPSAEQLAAYYNDASRTPTEDHFNKAASRRRRAFLRALRFLRYVVPGRSVLDLGCGGGFMVEAFGRLGARAGGLDISAGAIAYARKHFPRGTFYCEPMETFRARGLQFDFVFSSEVLEHVPGPDELLASFAAVTKPGGHLFVASPDAGHPLVPANIADWDQVAPPEHIQLFNRENARILFARFGFELAKAYPNKKPGLSLLFKRI
ncbi:MAG TPA: methyltransferase domain-containing protein [Stellaceae bacterium]|jgi:2-polyprenyl-3-methyl-5-hydroxy-6-metoxy-1,4-benzoquinol methylase